MAKKWAEVESSADYQKLSPQQQSEARDQYFNEVVKPNVPVDDWEKAKSEFDSYAKPSFAKSAKSISNYAIKAIQRGLSGSVVPASADGAEATPNQKASESLARVLPSVAENRAKAQAENTTADQVSGVPVRQDYFDQRATAIAPLPDTVKASVLAKDGIAGRVNQAATGVKENPIAPAIMQANEAALAGQDADTQAYAYGAQGQLSSMPTPEEPDNTELRSKAFEMEMQNAMAQGIDADTARSLAKQAIDSRNYDFTKAQSYIPDRSRPVGLDVASNALMRGVKMGSSIAQGATALAGAAVGADQFATDMVKSAVATMQEAGKYPAAIQDFTKIQSLSDVPTYMLEGVLENMPMLAGSFGAGAAGRYVAGKTLSNKAMQVMTAEAVAKELARRQTIGAAAGAGAASMAMESGSIFNDIYQETGELRPGVATSFGAVAGALDAIPAFMAVRTAFGKPVADEIGKTIFDRYGIDGLKQIAAEGATEFAQTWIESGAVSYVSGKPFINKENLIAATDAALKGGSAGGAMHVVAQLGNDIANNFGNGKEVMLDDDTLRQLMERAEIVNAKYPEQINTEPVIAEIQRRESLGTITRAAEISMREQAKASEALDMASILDNEQEAANVSDAGLSTGLAAGAGEFGLDNADGSAGDGILLRDNGLDRGMETDAQALAQSGEYLEPAGNAGDGTDITVSQVDVASGNIVTSSGKPYKTEFGAQTALKAKGLAGQYEVKPVDGGFALAKIDNQSPASLQPEQPALTNELSSNPLPLPEDQPVGNSEQLPESTLNNVQGTQKNEPLNNQHKLFVEHGRKEPSFIIVKRGTKEAVSSEIDNTEHNIDVLNKKNLKPEYEAIGITEYLARQNNPTLSQPKTESAPQPTPEAPVLSQQKTETQQEPAPVLSSVNDLKTVNTESNLRPIIERLVKRRAAARQSGIEKAFDNALSRAKKAMAGETVKADYFTNLAKIHLKNDKETAAIFSEIGEAIADTDGSADAKFKKEQERKQAQSDRMKERQKQLRKVDPAKDAKRNTGESDPSDFKLTGSDRPADQAAASGAQDLFENKQKNVREALVKRMPEGGWNVTYKENGQKVRTKDFDVEAEAQQDKINWENGTKANEIPLSSQESELDEMATLGYQAGIDGNNTPPYNANTQEKLDAWNIGRRRAKDESVQPVQEEQIHSTTDTTNVLSGEKVKQDQLPDATKMVDQVPEQSAPEPVTQETEAKPATPLSPYDNAMDEYRKGIANVDDYKAAFKYVLEHEKEITEYLDTLTKKQLFDRGGYALESRYKSEKKERVVRALYGEMVMDFLLPNESGMTSYTHSFGGDKYESIKKQIDAITQESLNKAMQRLQDAIKEREAKKAEKLKGIEDPKTIDDFQNLLRTKIETGISYKEARLELTPEQRATYDDLAATQTMASRAERKEVRQTTVQTAGQTVSGEIIETKHTQKGHDLFVVQLSERVSREDYNTLNVGAKKLGGYYSSFRGRGAVPGFQFTTRENAQAFVDLAGGNTESAKEAIKERRDAFEDDKSQSAVERLTEMADRLDDKADEQLNRDRKVNTQRRAGMAARAEANANYDKAMAETMRNIAKGIESGNIKFLGKVRQKAQVELLQTLVHNGQYDYLRSKYKTYDEYEKRRHDKPVPEIADYVEFPSYTANRSDLAKLGRAMQETAGLKMLGDKILSVANDVTDAYLKFAKENLHKAGLFTKSDGQRAVFPTKKQAEEAIIRSGFGGKAIVLPFKKGENIIILSPAESRLMGIWQGDDDKRITLPKDFGNELVEKIGKAQRRNSKVELPWQFENAYTRLEKLKRMGIETPPEMRAALREFINLREAPPAVDKVKELERKMIGRRADGLDFFPTPASIADEMVEAADIREGMSILEPSAGMGHIADRIREAGFEPDVIELSGDRRELLEAKGYNLVGSDFMDYSGQQYDRIIMNPPFSDRRDMLHVQQAYELLKPGGRLVSIMGEGVFFGSDGKANQFREWLESVGGTSEKMEAGTFMDSSLPVNTGVSTRMVVIDKPEGATSFSRSPMKSVDSNVVRGEKAMNEALLNKADVNRAMYHNELGWIDFVWGDYFKGIQHIINQRIAKDGLSVNDIYKLLTKDLVDTIASGEVIRKSQINNNQQVVVAKGDYEAILVRNKGNNGWLLSGWKLKPSDAIKAGNDTKKATQLKADSTDNKLGAEAVRKELSTLASDYVNRVSFSRGSNAGMAPELVEQFIGSIKTIWSNAPRMVVVSDMNDAKIRPAVRAENERQLSRGATGKPEGFYDAGTVYLVASELNSLDDVIRVLFHETLGHAGLRGTFGSALDNILDQIYMTKRPTVMEKAKQYGLAVTMDDALAEVKKRAKEDGENLSEQQIEVRAERLMKADQRLAAEEVLAEMAQTNPKLGFVQRAIAAIKTFLRKLGVNIELSDDEIIRDLIIPARDFIKNGRGEQSVQDLVAAFNRSSINPSTSALFQALTANDEIFQYAKSESKDMQQVFDDVVPGLVKVEKSKINDDEIDEFYNIYPRDIAGQVLRNQTGQIMVYKDGKVELNVAQWKEGYGGSGVYAAVGNWAFNNGLVFSGDREGITAKGKLRRLENMISLALKFGTTDFIEPHPEQMQELGFDWKQGDTEYNLEQMLEASYKAIRNGTYIHESRHGIDITRKAPGQLGVKKLDDLVYDFDSNQFIDTSNGKPFTDAQFKLLAQSSAARATMAGSSTLKRAAIAHTFVLEKDRGGAQQLLERLGQLTHQSLQGSQLDRVFYSRSNPDKNLSDSTNNLKEIVSEYKDKNRRIREEHITLKEKVNKWLRRQLTPGGLLPQSVFKEKIARDSEFQAIEFDIAHMINSLENAIKSDYGIAANKLDEEVQRLLNDVMAGKAIPESVPERTRVSLLGMRKYIDGLSEQYLAGLQAEIEAMIEVADGNQNENSFDGFEEKIALYETIAGNIGQYVHRSYRAFDDKDWYKKLPDDVLDKARRYLINQNMQTMSKDEAERRAENVLNEMLKNGTAYDSMSAFIRESKLGAKDLSVFKRRKEIAPEIRALLGEYTDPRINFAKSATKMGRLIFNQKFLDHLLTHGMGEFLFNDYNKPPEATAKISADSSEVMAPLNGLWVTPEIDQAFKDAVGKEKMEDWYRTIIKINGLVKYGKTVLSPTTAARNWLSAFFFTLANGHLDYRHMKTSIDGFKEYFGKGSDLKSLAYLRELKQLGVVYDTPYAGEIMKLLADSEIGDTLLLGSKTQDVKKMFDLATKFYQYGDDFFKIIGYENEKNIWLEHGLSEQQAKEKAAERIRNTYPTYSMVGKGIQSLRRFPLAGTFVSFPAEIIRTSGNMLRYLHEDYQDPKTRDIAIRRGIGLAIASGFGFALQALSMALLGYDDDDDEATRLMSAPWQRNSTFVYTGRDENGNTRYIDISSLDPYNYWKRPIVAIMRNQPYKDKAKDAVIELGKPFFGEDILAGALKELVVNKKDSGGNVYKEHDSLPSQSVDIANHLRKALQPGIASNVERIYKALDDETTPSGKKYDLTDEVAALVGFRMSTLDPKVALYYRSFDFTDAKNEASKKIREVATNPNDVSSSDLQSAYRSAVEINKEAYSNMIILVNAAKKSGLSDVEIRRSLKNSGVTNRDIHAIINGEIPSWRPSYVSIHQQVKKSKSMFGNDQAKKVRERYREISEYASSSGS